MMLKAIAFDFDGVLAESTEVKTRAFAHLFACEPSEAVQRIVEYHLKNYGLSRFDKFKVIYKNILDRSLSGDEFQAICDRFARLVFEKVVVAPWVAGAREFLVRHRSRYRYFFIISGTPEEELREIVRRRSMDKFFDEVLGSPRTKGVLLQDAMNRNGLQPGEVVFVGDAATDWIAARQTGVGFIWRRVSDDLPEMMDFTGPSIPSLTYLDACLSTFERKRS